MDQIDVAKLTEREPADAHLDAVEVFVLRNIRFGKFWEQKAKRHAFRETGVRTEP